MVGSTTESLKLKGDPRCADDRHKGKDASSNLSKKNNKNAKISYGNVMDGHVMFHSGVFQQKYDKLLHLFLLIGMPSV